MRKQIAGMQLVTYRKEEQGGTWALHYMRLSECFYHRSHAVVIGTPPVKTSADAYA
jgi:hypothetical protein